ncbi:MAG TPA: ATP-binding protein [Symbiobacteriaceae bacterium]|jgi:PAS domain S-box-containing protein|nr:ATP-binding protein [Symbiobacteriaceae bacterium]
MRRLATWLVLAITGVLLLATLARTAMLSYSLRTSQESQAVEAAMENARDIAIWAGERWDRAPVDIRFSLSALARLANARVWLVSAEGRVWVDTEANPSWEGVTIESPELKRALGGHESRVPGRSPWLESAVACVVPVVHSGKILGAVYLFLPVQSEGSGPFMGPLFWSAVIALSLAILVAVYVARRLAAPVETITQFARSLGEGNFTGSVKVRSVEEVNVLADTLTQVSGHLNASFGALAAERQRLTAILESMQEGVVVADPGGRLTLVNPAAARLLGWQEPADQPLSVVSPVFPELLRQGLLQAMNGETQEVHLRLGETQDLLAICSPVPTPDGQATGALAVLRDLSSVLRLQRLRENFLADVAHELRSPLANLSVLAEAFGDGTIGWEEKDPYIRTLQDEVARLTRLSRDVLDLTQLDAGVIAVTMEWVDLAAYVASVASRMQERFRAAGVALVCAVPPGLQVHLAPMRMEQVLSNLLENALRHTPSRGTVRVEAGRAGEDQVCLKVIDTGSGIAPEHLPHIFERFYKADPARTPGRSGTGLGLSIVRKLVELQGGHVAVTSESGAGTEFRVYIAAKA